MIDRNGFALLVALMVLSVVSVIGLYLALVATAEVRISDNFESLVQARAAAFAGLNHGRALVRGLCFDDLLEGPDGTHDAGAAYLALAKTHGYRNPAGWATARILDIFDPSGALAALPDDGTINTGRHPGGPGLAVIPLLGIAQAIPNPYGPGTWVKGRYFVKTSDNNGEAAELAEDPIDDPFHDGDSQIILRSMGVARTIAEVTQAGLRLNSVVVLEARLKRLHMFDLDAPLVIQSSDVDSSGGTMFEGNMFAIRGGASNPAIAAIDTSATDGVFPVSRITSRLLPAQQSCITGFGLKPSVTEITGAVASHADKRHLLDPIAMCRLLVESLPQFADNVFIGNQNWVGSTPAPLGHYDPGLPQPSPGQDPKVTFVNGDLLLGGDIAGGGLLVVSGKLTVTGRFDYSGLILVLGTGELDIGGDGSITGAMFLSNLSCAGKNWGSAKFTIRDSAQIVFDRAAIGMALTLIPPVQLSFREITTAIDPGLPIGEW